MNNKEYVKSLIKNVYNGPITVEGSTTIVVSIENRVQVKDKLQEFLKKTNTLFKDTTVSKSSLNGTQIIYDNKPITIVYKNISSGKIDAKTTKMQELGSAWIFRRALRDNQVYSNYLDIIKDPKYPDLIKIYPGVVNSEDWLENYFLQQQTMLKEFSNSQFTEFTRDGGFMDYITNLVRVKYGIVQKDVWNPADIWLSKNESSVIADIERLINNNKYNNIGLLNQLLRTMFKQRRLIGISLKKISGKIALYEEINVEDVFKDGKHYNFDVTQIKIDLSYNPVKKTFGTQDSRVFVDTGVNGIVNFQIKANDSSKKSNLKWEPTSTNSSSARLGKAPVDIVISILKEYNISFNNTHGSYPTNQKEFQARAKEYVSMFNNLKRNRYVDVSITTDKQFLDNMVAVFMSTSAHVANSKLMQLEFLNRIIKLPKEKMDQLFTELTFIAMRKGDKFGPFAKLY